MEASENPQPWKDYVSSHTLFQELARLKEEGWSNPAGDEFFKKRRDCVIKANHRARLGLYRMTQEVSDGLASATGLLDLYGTSSPRILDLCMAPGGFSMTSKKRLPRSIIDAITHPTELGGYQVASPEIFNEIIYADITIEHPDSAKFHTARPYLENKYDVVFCGGIVCKNHPREEYRSVDCEAPRLWASELLFALNRLKPSGSLVLLLHRVQSWSTVCLIHAFSQFSDVQLIKHPKFHSIKSSLYLVARNIDLEHETAKSSIHYWRCLWRYLTFGQFSSGILPPSSRLYDTDSDFACQLRDEFGPRFVELARPVWEIQKNALRASVFTNPSLGE